ncbi:uncharacterized protein ACNS7B_001299 isoform 2-T2 [Menidia menidia]|uniref:(Atlantic silverside) hypothetical protein n=1 Tax=Menidia menidia TaxID=238744 RepID=A0A8S4B6L8_9TELE|nr:unnamed protein product [Menidia menidia]
MCRETMDGTSELTKIDYLRQNAKFGSELKWKFVRVSTDENEAFKRCRATRLTNRKRTRREPKRRELARLAKLYEVTGKKDEKESAIKGKDSAACTQRPPAGAMAPENTTQYLMSNVYDDVETEYHRSDKTSGTLRKCLT